MRSAAGKPAQPELAGICLCRWHDAVKTEFQKMIAGEIYNPRDPEICAARDRAHGLCAKLNQMPDTDRPARRALVRDLFNAPATDVWIESPFLCDYGINTILGKNVYFNFDCLILDTAPVRIGDNVMFAPGVHIYTATHPVDADERKQRRRIRKTG